MLCTRITLSPFSSGRANSSPLMYCDDSGFVKLNSPGVMWLELADIEMLPESLSVMLAPCSSN